MLFRSLEFRGKVRRRGGNNGGGEQEGEDQGVFHGTGTDGAGGDGVKPGFLHKKIWIKRPGVFSDKPLALRCEIVTSLSPAIDRGWAQPTKEPTLHRKAEAAGDWGENR